MTIKRQSVSPKSINSVVQTTCPYCGVGCGIDVQPKSGDLGSQKVKVAGTDTHPANFGKLCVKGAATGETVDFEGRMLTPQINGDSVDWETALTTVAETFQKTIEQYGSESVAFYVSGQLLTEDYYVANKLIKGYLGSANIDTNSRLCMASAVVGYKRAFGTDTVPCSYQDLEMADLITLVGSNAAWAHPILYQRIAAAKKARPQLKVVVVDPRRTATCDLADLHLAIKPGMDAALFNGLLAYLSQKGAINQTYLERHTEGAESAIAAAVAKQGDMALLATQCDLSITDLQQWFDWAIETPRMVTLYSQGVNQSTSGVDKSNAIINCHLATGRIGYEGAGPFSITGQPNAMGGREVGGLANQLAAHMDFSQPDNVDRVARFWRAPNMAKKEGLKAVDMFKAVGTGKIKAIWIMNTNPVVSMPDADAVRRALKQCEFVVVSDCMQSTDTTEVADVLLPALTWGETDGSVTNSDRTISMQRRFMSGPENARADWWMICEVAKKMGFTQAFDYAGPVDIFREHARLSAFENDESGWLRDFNLSAFVDITPEQYRDFQPIQWPVTKQTPGGTPRMFADGLFFTSNRKARLIAIDPHPPASQTSEAYPFVFNTGRIRDQWHTMTRTAKTERLMMHKNEPYLTLHPQDALKLGLAPGDLAKASNALGVFVGRVEVSASQRLGEVFAPMHWTAQYASHGRVDALIAANVDPLSGQPESKHATVKVEPYPVDWYGFVLTREPVDMSSLGEEAYWVKIKGQQFLRYEIAGRRALGQVFAWAKSLLKFDDSQDWLEYEDPGKEQYRAASMLNGKLQSVLFIAPQSDMPSREWLEKCFSEQLVEGAMRRSLLAGSASGAKDTGKTICTCFNVGLNTIVEMIETERLTTVAEIGQVLKAGTNCGSCVPELKEILADVLELT